jgi:DNA-binding HxlR family transcriptional regulator
VLYERLRQLTAAGLVDRDAAGRYRLTPTGTALGAALEPLDSWSRRWAQSQREP